MQFDLGGEVRRDGLARKTELTAEFQVIHAIQSWTPNIQSYSETKCPAVTRGIRSQNRNSTLDRCKATSKFES